MNITLKVFFLFLFSNFALAAIRPPHAGLIESTKTLNGTIYTEVKKMGDYLLIYPMKLSSKNKWEPISASEISNALITMTHPKIKKRTTLNLVAQKDIFSVPMLYSKDPTLLISLQYVYKKQAVAFSYTLNNVEEQK
jgi:hypothetical protein